MYVTDVTYEVAGGWDAGRVAFSPKWAAEQEARGEGNWTYAASSSNR